MSIFQDVILQWQGREYKVESTRVMAAICVVEDVVTFPELVQGLQVGRPNMSKVARAYGALLRYAGAKVSDEEVYSGMFTPGSLQEQIALAINTLMVIMTPPNALKDAAAENAAAIGDRLGEALSPGKSPAASLPKSSKRSSKRRLAAAG